MSNENKSITIGGSGCCFTLFIVFLVLKLCNVITWSWWWITAPLWIPPLILAAFIVPFLFIWFVVSLINR